MKVHWLNAASANLEGLRSTHIASTRLRTAVAAFGAAKQPERRTLTVGPELPAQSCDMLVVGKIMQNRPNHHISWIEAAEQTKARGGKVVVDYTDDHLSKAGPTRRFYVEALALADYAVCSGAMLKDALLDHAFTKHTYIIPDAMEVEIVPPKQTLQQHRTALWFGHHLNIPYLIDFIISYRCNIPLKVIVLTSVQGINEISKASHYIPKNMTIVCCHWSTEGMAKQAIDSDICVIPANPADPWKNYASSNRLLTALGLGLPTAAAPLMSYQEFSRYFVDIKSDAFIEMLETPLRYSGAVVEAQKTICPRFSIPTLAEKWWDVLGQM
jgi:hypothetical protein